MGSVAYPRYTPSPTCVTMSNLVVLQQRVCAYRREPPKLGSAGAPPLGMGRGWPLKTSPLPICVTMSNFDSSAIKGARINRKEPPKLGSTQHGTPPPSGRGMAEPLEIRSSPRVTIPNLAILGQTVRTLLRRCAWKFDPSHSAFQGHLRSSEPTQIEPSPMISFCWRSIVIMCLSRTVSELNGDGWKSQIFPTPRVSND